MAAVRPAGPEPAMRTWRRSVMAGPRSGAVEVGARGAAGPQDESSGHQDGAEDVVGGPDLAGPEVDGHEADQGDAEHHHHDDGHGGDDDAEDDGPGPDEHRAHGAVADRVDHPVDGVG